VDEVIIFCVNDVQVMEAWAKNQGVEKGGFIKMLGDPSGSVARAFAGVIEAEGPVAKLGPGRSKRFAAYVEKGTVKFINVSEKPDDPAGDDFPEASCAEAVMDGIKELHK